MDLCEFPHFATALLTDTPATKLLSLLIFTAAIRGSGDSQKRMTQLQKVIVLISKVDVFKAHKFIALYHLKCAITMHI